jgi:hypothetical protein
MTASKLAQPNETPAWLVAPGMGHRPFKHAIGASLSWN